MFPHPHIGEERCLIPRWSCSSRLFRYVFVRCWTLLLIVSRIARGWDVWPSVVTSSGTWPTTPTACRVFGTQPASPGWTDILLPKKGVARNSKGDILSYEGLHPASRQTTACLPPPNRACLFRLRHPALSLSSSPLLLLCPLCNAMMKKRSLTRTANAVCKGDKN